MSDSLFGKILQPAHDLVWGPGEPSHPLLRWLRAAARVTHMVAREIASGQLTLRSMGLVYTTLLSIVPLLAVSFSVLKGFGIHNQLEPALLRILYPLGPKAPEITVRIVEFVENVKVGLLGFVGLGLLIYTVISLLHKIESAFNETWRIRHQRSFGKRFTDYLSVLLVGPVLVFLALGMTASLLDSSIAQRALSFDSLAWFVEGAGRLAPVALVVAAFSFVYVFLPNTRVKWVPAFVGAVVAGVLWESAGWGFAAFVASSKSTSAIYSSFAILIIFMIWLYVSWLILLVGSTVAFYVQHPEYLGLLQKEVRISARMRERIGLQAMVAIARRHYRAQPPYAASELAEQLGVPLDPVQHTLSEFASRRYLLAVDVDGEVGYVPARDLTLLALTDIISTLRSTNESRFLQHGRIAADSVVEDVLGEIDAQRASVLGDRTLRDLMDVPERRIGLVSDLQPASTRGSSSPAAMLPPHVDSRGGTE